MRKLLALFGLLLCASLSWAQQQSASTTLPITVNPATNDIFISLAGGGTGNSCAGPLPFSFFNTVGNWGVGAGKIGPGVTVHICGTNTLAMNTNALTVQGSGSNGSPVTIKFETGAGLQSPQFPGNPVASCSSNCAAIDTNGKSYITIDGGTNGFIQNTNNGTALANHAPTMGVYLRGDHVMMKNLTIQHMYTITSAEQNVPNPPGFYSVDVLVGGGSNAEVCNNTLNNSHIGLQSSSVSATLTTPPSSLCTAIQANDGVNLYNNTTRDHGWQINIGGNGYSNVFNNDSADANGWFFPTGTNSYHIDGFIIFGGSPNSIPKPQIFNNYIHMDLGPSPTGLIFCTYDGSNDGSGSQCTIYNNILVGTGGSATAAQGIFIRNCETVAPFGCGPHAMYNNTISGFNTGSIFNPYDPNVHIIVKNNIIISGGGWYIQPAGGSNPFANIVSNRNDFFGGRNFGGGVGGFPSNQDLAGWRTGSGNDTNSVELDPNLDVNYHIQNTSSPAYGLGFDLSGLGINNLNKGCNSTFGVGAVNDGNTRSGRWNAGACQF